MAGLTTPAQTNMLNLLKGTTWPTAAGAWQAPVTTYYVGLFTTNPTSDAATSNGSVEVSGSAYARQPITASSGWSAIVAGAGQSTQISNSAIITFPTPSGSWGTIIGVGIFDASTAGNLWLWNSITSQAIGAGVIASFAIGALIFNMD
jgi:hypothetical protein